MRRDRHILSVLVENKPGVLARIALMFARRGYNIHSLAVGPTEDERVSRLTIVVGTEAVLLEQTDKQLNKLIPVPKITELGEEAVEPELQLVKASADSGTRTSIIELAEVFRAKVVDVAHDTITLEAAGNPRKLEAMLQLLEPFGIREFVRSGTISLSRGATAPGDSGRARMRRVI